MSFGRSSVYRTAFYAILKKVLAPIAGEDAFDDLGGQKLTASQRMLLTFVQDTGGEAWLPDLHCSRALPPEKGFIGKTALQRGDVKLLK